MRTATLILAWLIGYYYEECPVCGRYIAILNNGKIVGWCSRKKHESVSRKEGRT